MAANVERIQQQIQSELEKFKGVQKDLQKSVSTRQQLDAQLTENNVVKEELEKIESSGEVYKLIGPVLVKQDLEEAKQTVAKRIEYISGEIKRQDTTIKETEKRQSSSRESLNKLQQDYQQAITKAALKA
ncbi:prefoldin subunit 6-like [Actinia tenebrosa]|uniref:Prefoldin subunit 6-like n=1 Tax=Actinia tenebrosa TaxID=6105 RepID=A0A6P8J478_ACTTE|nr:prefoldin subunit 6-like [Actinia tenebrosa]